MFQFSMIFRSSTHFFKPVFSSFVKKRLQITSLQRCSTFESDLESDDEEFEEIINGKVERQRRLGQGRNVFVIQPRAKYGKSKTELLSRTLPELQLEESVSLARTLKNWNVVAQEVVTTANIRQKYIFGTGKLDEIASTLAQNPKVDTLFISVEKLQGWQQYDLQQMFNVDVFDRFSVVLEIFKQHATTKEAKLQVALAEIPYIKSRLRQTTEDKSDRATGTLGQIGCGETYLEMRKRLYEERELKLKRLLAKMNLNRDKLRSHRQNMRIPTIAVVGYTNCGKTSLIKALTKDERLEPRNDLFATLDVTCHAGRIGCLDKVLFVDTVGFMSDIPSSLIQAFKSTLKEVELSDLVIHVNDINHPDLKNQRLTVNNTLSHDLDLGPKLSTTMIEVGNKVDKLSDPRNAPTGCDILVSATEGINLDELEQEIEKRLMINIGCFLVPLRVRMGSDEYSWINRHCNIISQEVDSSDGNFTFMTIGFDEMSFGKFKKTFGSGCLVNNRQDQKVSKRYVVT